MLLSFTYILWKIFATLAVVERLQIVTILLYLLRILFINFKFTYTNKTLFRSTYQLLQVVHSYYISFVPTSLNYIEGRFYRNTPFLYTPFVLLLKVQISQFHMYWMCTFLLYFSHDFKFVFIVQSLVIVSTGSYWCYQLSNYEFCLREVISTENTFFR